MKKAVFILIIMQLAIHLQAQIVFPGKYWVQFTDKSNSKYSVDRPHEFLSQRAILRREKMGIAITENDIPVNERYVDSLQQMNVKILNKSRWFNAAVVQTNDSLLMDTIHKISFITTYKKPTPKYKPKTNYCTGGLKDNSIILRRFKKAPKNDKYDYGEAHTQIDMLSGKTLHNEGFDGKDIHIAVLDAGFYHVHQLPSFDSAWNNDQMLGVYDFVDNDQMVFDSDYHGMKVLSTIAANMPGIFVGTAPRAKFWLLRSEDASTEYLIEECNWIAAAEFADSAGVDIITSSLGYTDFDNQIPDRSYADLDGNTARVTIGADIAASKGILVVNSAGNSASEAWHYIGAPADADSVLAVGAVTWTQKYAYFSSTGPTPDRRMKPNVTAMGYGTVVQGAKSGTSTAFGTSFSAPVTTGMAASFWQSHPELNNIEVLHAIEYAGNQYYFPDSLLGYGIPDFTQAYLFPNGIADREAYFFDTEQYTNLCNSLQYKDVLGPISAIYDRNKTMRIVVYDMTGRKLVQQKVAMKYAGNKPFVIGSIKNLTRGSYFLQVFYNNNLYEFLMLKK